jgi:hypothetical protein
MLASLIPTTPAMQNEEFPKIVLALGASIKAK